MFCDRYKVPKGIILNSFFTKFSVMYRNTGSSLDLGVLFSVWIIHRLVNCLNNKKHSCESGQVQRLDWK